MRFSVPLTEGIFHRRYKRFFADVTLAGGRAVTVHVASTGSMMGCSDPGARVAVSHHPDKGRKLPWSLELVWSGGAWVGVNTALPNFLVEEAILDGRIAPLSGYPVLRREAKYGRNSRIDLLLTRGEERCYVEVKNVTLRDGDVALFPDAVTARGARHLCELQAMVAEGHRAVMLFLVNRGDCASVEAARRIDPYYAEMLEQAAAAGVEMLAYRTEITLEGIEVKAPIPVRV